jgi:hypothetical protein
MLLILAVAPIAAAGELTPLVTPPTWSPRVAQPVALTLPADVARSVSPKHVRLIVRSRGAQRLITPEISPDSGAGIWRFTPNHQGTCVIATVIEPPADATTGATFRYEKLFVQVAPEDPAALAPKSPSASATARFAHRLELAPLVDPACLLVGADLPLRVKFEGVNATGVQVIARCQPVPSSPGGSASANTNVGAGDRPRAARSRVHRLTTNQSAAVNVPIDRPGLWTITTEHRPANKKPGDAGPARFVATMMFVVHEPDAAQADPGSR